MIDIIAYPSLWYCVKNYHIALKLNFKKSTNGMQCKKIL